MCCSLTRCTGLAGWWKRCCTRPWEDYALDIVIGKGPGARSIRLKLPKFTIIGATTRLALMTAPLRSRFGAVYRLDFYDLEAMQTIVNRFGRDSGCGDRPGGSGGDSPAGAGTPRVANRLLKAGARLRPGAGRRRHYPSGGRRGAFADGVDPLGLDDIDRRVMRTVIDKFDGGPVGLENDRRCAVGGAGHDHGCGRAVPVAAWFPGPDATRARRHAAGI